MRSVDPIQSLEPVCQGFARVGAEGRKSKDGTMRRQAAFWLIAALPMFSGCYRAEVRNDGNQARRALLDMYTDQAMDNLILAYENLPFVQLNYHDLLVQATDQYTGTFTNAQTFGANRSLTFINLAASAMRTVGTAFSFGGTAQRQDLISFKADPVTDQDDIYVRYLKFARNRDSFQVLDHQPNFKVHLMRKHNGCYYYVPCEAAEKFMDLILVTTLQRGFNAAQSSYAVTIKGAQGDPSVDLVTATITFNSQVPNGDGLLLLTLAGGRTVTLQVGLVGKGPDNKAGEGDPIDHLIAQWSQSKKKLRPDELKYARGQLFSDHFPPAVTAIDTTLKRVNSNLDSIRANTSISTLQVPLTR